MPKKAIVSPTSSEDRITSVLFIPVNSARFIEFIENEWIFCLTIPGIIMSTGIAWMKAASLLSEDYLIILNYSDWS